jgi:hypothetical protein
MGTNKIMARVVFIDEIGPIAETTVDASRALAVVIWCNEERVVDFTEMNGLKYVAKGYEIQQLRTGAYAVELHMVTILDHAKRTKPLKMMPRTMTWEEYEEIKGREQP